MIQSGVGMIAEQAEKQEQTAQSISPEELKKQAEVQASVKTLYTK